MLEKVAKVRVRMASGYFYFLDLDGDISRRKIGINPRSEKVAKLRIKKQQGNYYYIDSQGDVSCVRLAEEIPQGSVRPEDCGILEDERKGLLRESIEQEERKRIQEKQLRYEVRREILQEGFTNLQKDQREKIPEEVQHEVWRRDGGKCVRCDSRERLEFDHIIPISRGGSNTTRNIEILCEKCNREKSNNI